MKAEASNPFAAGPAPVGVGAELGSYRLTSLIGQGAMGRVFKAKHLRLGREVAVKVLNPEYAARPDVLVYTGAPLEKPLEVTGPIKVVLYASSSAPVRSISICSRSARSSGSSERRAAANRRLNCWPTGGRSTCF